MANSPSRYSRQTRFAPLGEEGQERLCAATVLVAGCGALGSVIAERLARAGVGRIKIVDRDWVEWSNLQRQSLFTEEDARCATPKAAAAAEAIRRINSEIQVDYFVEDLNHETIQQFADDCDLVMDGLDNFETRFLINDYCIRSGKPWIHGGCLGAAGQVLSVLPGESACFRCLVPDLPPRETTETCDSAGVLGSAIGIIASWQSGEALKVLSGNKAAVCRGLIVIDSWSNDCRVLNLPKNATCKACVENDFVFLNGDVRTTTTVLCGKNAVQIDSPLAVGESLSAVSDKLRSLGDVVQNAFFVRLSLPEHTITIFKGGRTVVEGTTSEADAKSIVAQTLGG